MFGMTDWIRGRNRKPISQPDPLPVPFNPNEHGVHLITEDARREVFSVRINVAASSQESEPNRRNR
jgi:hypothetical protein